MDPGVQSIFPPKPEDGAVRHPSTSLHLDAAGGHCSQIVRHNKLFRQWAARADYFAGHDELPLGMALEPTADPTCVTYRGRRLVNFGTNNYFGSTHLEPVREAAKRAIDLYGVGSTASRLAGGTNPLHLEVEAKLSRMFGRAGCIIFNTGFSANHAVLSVLGRSVGRLFIDEECHASLYEGARGSGARIVRFRHNNVEHLQRLLAKQADPEGLNMVVVDGLYSMSGSIAPLREIVELKSEMPFMLLCDEAHSFGTLGPTGLGAAETAGCLDAVDIVTGTFSKAIGSVGGFACFTDPSIELLRFAAPCYMYTAAMPPPNLAAISAALDCVITEGAELRRRLHRNCRRLSEMLEPLAGPGGTATGPVFSLPLDGIETTIDAWSRLLDEGVYVNIVLPPASPGGRAMLRVGVSAAHSERQIDTLAALLHDRLRRSN